MTTAQAQRRSGRADAAMRLSLLSFCAGLFASPLAALEVAECELLVIDQHYVEEGHTDLGNGFVYFRGTLWHHGGGISEDGVEWFILPRGNANVANCETAETLQVHDFTASHVLGEPPIFDIRSEVIEVILAYTGEASSVEIEDLAMALGERSYDFSVEFDEYEPCACRIAYPSVGVFAEPFDLDHAIEQQVYWYDPEYLVERRAELLGQSSNE